MIKKLSHITLAVLVLISSTGLVTHLHYCQSELKTYSFFFEPEPCPKEIVKPPCHAHKQHTKKPAKPGCCDDDISYSKLDVEQLAQSFQITPPLDETQQFLQIDSYKQYLEVQTGITHYLNYKPPLLVCDYRPLFQTFLC